jgi:hypothetical protein
LDPPGNQMGTAIKRGALAHKAGHIPAFLSWFKALFRFND